MSYVTVEASQVLQEMGYPREGWPQCVWWREFMQRVKAWSEWELGYFDEHDLGPHTLGQEGKPADQWLAAPDELTGLMWLEQERGYRWFRSALFYAGEWQMWNTLEGPTCVADTPSALIVAIGAHWRSAQGQKQGQEDLRNLRMLRAKVNTEEETPMASETVLLTCAALVPWDASHKAQRNCRRRPAVYRNDKWWCNQHAPFNDVKIQTHSAECWRWHHACAVARVEELRAALAGLLEDTVINVDDPAMIGQIVQDWMDNQEKVARAALAHVTLPESAETRP